MARRKRRSSEQVLRDMARDKEKRDAEASTGEAGQDRADTRDPQAPASSPTETASPSEGSSSEAEQDAGRPAAEEKQLETTTKASAKVVEPPKRTFAQCPRCGERRFSPDLVGKTVKCINCRTGQKLI
jgi:hypothetical protein